MPNAQRYYDALLLCEDLEQRGLINLVMPESNLIISDKLQGRERERAVDALNIYVRAYKLMGRANWLAALIVFILGAELASNLVAWGI